MNEEEKKVPENSEKVAEKNATSFAGKKSSTPKKPVKKNRKNANRLLYNPRIRKNNPVQPSQEVSDSDEKKDQNLADTEQKEKNQEEVKKDNEKKVKKTNNSQSKVKTIIEGIARIQKLKLAIIILIPCFVIILIIILFGAIAGIVSSDDESANSYCQVSGSGGTLISFIAGWECGGLENCPNTCTVDGESGWYAADFHDNAITIGPGLTNWVMNDDVANFIEQNGWKKYFGETYNLVVGKCVPRTVVEKIQLYVLETQFAKAVEEAMEKYDVELTQFQKDALTSLGYTHGAHRYTDELVKAYKDGGYKGLWFVMKNCIKAGYETGFKKRSKGEFALFVTGDYSDQGLFYSRSLDNYDDYNSEGVLNRRVVCGNPLSTNYTVATSTGSNDMLTKPLKDRLQELGTSYQEYNEYILNSVIKAGVGTRAGVVAAAVSLVGGLYEKYNIRIPYTWAGQHGGSIEGVPNPAEFFGVHPLWGTYINHYVHNSEVNRTYYYYGPDCSGFVGWALNNGGMVPHFSEMYNLGPNLTPTTNRVGDPGDIVHLPGHYMLIVGVDEEAKQYYCAEAAGGDSGVRIKAYDFSNLGGGARIIDLDDFYNDPSQKRYTDAETFAEAFRAGELQY